MLSIATNKVSEWKETVEETSIRDVEAAFARFADSRGLQLAFAAYAIVFIWFGAVKLFPSIHTPVYQPVGVFMSGLGVPGLFEFLGIPYNLKAILMFIGAYEVVLGVAFLTRKMRVLIPMFLVHQVTTLLALVVAPTVFFNPPFLHVAGFTIPWMQGKFSAYVLKNLIFIGGFFVLVSKAYKRRGVVEKETEESS